MPNLVLNTCGTSLLTNLGIAPELRQLLNQSANLQRWDNMPVNVATTLQQHVATRQKLLINSDDAHAKRLSAELNGLLCWQSQPDWQPSPSDMYLLLATDTALGRATAEAICAWLQHHGYSAQVISAEGLNTASLHSFRQALSGLVRQLDELLSSYKSSGYQIQFNLTGGFKSLNGFLQALSTLYADNAFYLFDGSSEVMRIPTLPLTLDAEAIIRSNLNTVRRISKGLAVTPEAAAALPELLLFSIDDDVMLSEWGELLWCNSGKKIYQSQLHPSISPRVLFGAGFSASTKDLTPSLLHIVNERISDLAEYAESDCKKALKSLDPKQLKDKQYQGMWECDLDPHHRIFMHKDGHFFTLEKVAKALH